MHSILRFSLPRQHLIVQSQQWKHWNNVLNLFKANNNDFELILQLALVFIYLVFI